MSRMLKLGLVIFAGLWPMLAFAGPPPRDKSTWAGINTSGAIVSPFTDNEYIMQPISAPEPSPTVLIRNETRGNVTVFHTEDATDHHVLATFPPNLILNWIELHGLIHAGLFDPTETSLFNRFHEGYVRATGEIVVPMIYKSVGPYGVNGLTPVQTDTQAGYVDTEGNMVIPLQFKDAGSFGPSDLAPVKTEGGWGYINAHGTFVIPPQFPQARQFGANGLAPAEKGGLWGYIDRTGKFVIAPAYDDAQIFRPDGVAVVERKGKDQTYVDRDFGAWKLTAKVFAAPEHPFFGPDPSYSLDMTGHSSDGKLTWRIWTIGTGIDVTAQMGEKPAAIWMGVMNLRDFPDKDEDLANDLVALVSEPHSHSLRYAAELRANKANLLSTIAAMRQLSQELFGKQGLPCLPPTCVY